MGHHEGRQRLQHTSSSHTFAVVLTPWAEFSGTLMGFDDYVSKWTPHSFIRNPKDLSNKNLDMVLEDVTEL